MITENTLAKFRTTLTTLYRLINFLSTIMRYGTQRVVCKVDGTGTDSTQTSDQISEGVQSTLPSSPPSLSSHPVSFFGYANSLQAILISLNFHTIDNAGFVSIVRHQGTISPLKLMKVPAFSSFKPSITFSSPLTLVVASIMALGPPISVRTQPG